MRRDEIIRRVLDKLNISENEKQQLLEELLQQLGRPRREIPEEAKTLIQEYQTLKERLRQIRQQLKQYNLTPTGITIRRGYGDYDYRGTPAYNTVKEIIQSRRSLTTEELEEELKQRGYKGITGTIGVVLMNLRQDGLIRRENGRYVWTGE
jgi:hypothetical protein